MDINEIINQAFREAGLPEDDPVADMTRTIASVVGDALAQRNSPPSSTDHVSDTPARGTNEYDHEHRIPHFRSR